MNFPNDYIPVNTSSRNRDSNKILLARESCVYASLVWRADKKIDFILSGIDRNGAAWSH